MQRIRRGLSATIEILQPAERMFLSHMPIASVDIPNRRHVRSGLGSRWLPGRRMLRLHGVADFQVSTGRLGYFLYILHYLMWEIGVSTEFGVSLSLACFSAWLRTYGRESG